MIIIEPTILFITHNHLRFNILRNFPTRKVIKNHHDSAPTKILANPNRIENDFASAEI